MPGPVSDSFDPEWGTRSAAEPITEALDIMYGRVSAILGNREPMDIRELAKKRLELDDKCENAPLTEWEWRIIRFALERATDSI